MACQVRYLSSAGIHHREVKGLDALASSFPINWLVYASLNAFPPKSAPIEIDVLVVMDDRIVLLELKDWNGPLTANGDMWLHAGRRHRSPAILGNEKAKKIKNLIKNQIPQLSRIYVDSRVVLTATSTRDALPQAEQPHVLTLSEAKLLGDRKERDRLLGPVKLTNTKPNMLVKDFEKLFGNASYFQPLKMTWDGYSVTEEDFYVHRADVWREHRVQLTREERVKGLLRLWRFDKLPVGLNEPGGRRLIADREMKAFAFLDDHGSWMAERGILKQVGGQLDEVLTQHYQLLSIPSGWTTLRRYLERNEGEVASDHAIDIIHALASMVAELHSHGVAHRDIGDEAIWLGNPTSMSLTGFFSTTLPDDQSVSDYLDMLRTYSVREPDWDGTIASAKERDVRSLGLIMLDLAERESLKEGLPQGWADIARRAVSKPGSRYPNAISLADAIGELRSPSGPTVDQSRIDTFETPDIPYIVYPPAGPSRAGDGSTRYESFVDSTKVVVKVWNGLTRGDARRDYSILTMLEAASSLKAVPLPAAAPVAAMGLSPVGPFVVTRWVEGTTISGLQSADLLALLEILSRFVSAVDELHSRGLSHGDLHPENVIITESQSVALIDLLDISPVGQGRKRSIAWAPEAYERQSEQQIDRYATYLIVRSVLQRSGHTDCSAVLQIIREELGRAVIDTLLPLIHELERERKRLCEPPVEAFQISGNVPKSVDIAGDEDCLWVKSFRNDDINIFWITGLLKRVLLRTKGQAFESIETFDAQFADLGQGTRVRMKLSVAKGPVAGIEALTSFLLDKVPPEQPLQNDFTVEGPDWTQGDEEIEFDELDSEEAPQPSAPLLDISRMWLRAAEIEEETVLKVRLERRLADDGQLAVYEYQTPRPLEFEDDDIVEVRQGEFQGRRVGSLEVGRCDARQIAIREQRYPLQDGDYVSLVDRRDRVSKERRRRAVERLTGRTGVIPNLIDYFDPNANAAGVKYDLTVPEEELSSYGLNQGQQDAFQALLKAGPVGLLQGPPGSGKTRFIASFAHWLLKNGGAQRVLIASQSHEAVNKVLEEVLKTFRKQGGNADLLRVGSRGATERIQPYQARSLRERFRVRFENGLKTRVAHAASAAGVSRALVHDIVDVDQRLGRLLRSLELISSSNDSEMTRDDRRRLDVRQRTLARAFSREASLLLSREITTDYVNPSAIVEEAYGKVLVSHPKSSPSDLQTTRRLLGLANEWKDTLASGHRNFDEFLAKTKRVVAGTCVGLGQSQIRLEQGIFDWVIVDEAARCTSGELAVPIQLGSRVVLVGDQRQLRPMVDRAVQQGLRDEFPGAGTRLAETDFERAFASIYGRRNAQVLDEQYRMTPAISNLVSQIFYAPHGVALKPSPDREIDNAFNNLPSDLGPAVVWFDTSRMPNSEERDRNEHRDIWNEAEIDTVMSLLHRISNEQGLVDLLAKRSDPAIGVICMYSEQKRLIEREWSQRPFTADFRRIVTIDTVDAYQGKENSIVIVSLVRANPEKSPGHVGREHRCNVALSRAKERLFIVGNRDMWSSHKCRSPMRRVLKHIEGLGEADGSVRSAGEIRK